jgi:Tol biopolymer transport system component
MYFSSDKKIHLVDLNNSSDSIFMEGYVRFGWSPDGDRVALVPSEGPPKLVTIDFVTKSILAEYDIPFSGYKLDWSPDGKWISLGFAATPDSLDPLAVLNLETKQVLTIKLDGLAYCWYPSWSSDGSLLAFEAWEAGTQRRAEIFALPFPTDLMEN